MLDLSRDIHPLTDFKRNTAEFLSQLKTTGQPVVLTINGKAELVVQDARSYQRLLELAERLETIEAVQEGLASMKCAARADQRRWSSMSWRRNSAVTAWNDRPDRLQPRAERDIREAARFILGESKSRATASSGPRTSGRRSTRSRPIQSVPYRHRLGCLRPRGPGAPVRQAPGRLPDPLCDREWRRSRTHRAPLGTTKPPRRDGVSMIPPARPSFASGPATPPRSSHTASPRNDEFPRERSTRERKQLFEANPKRYTFEPPKTGG